MNLCVQNRKLQTILLLVVLRNTDYKYLIIYVLRTLALYTELSVY